MIGERRMYLGWQKGCVVEVVVSLCLNLRNQKPAYSIPSRKYKKIVFKSIVTCLGVCLAREGIKHLRICY